MDPPPPYESHLFSVNEIILEKVVAVVYERSMSCYEVYLSTVESVFTDSLNGYNLDNLF